MKIIVRGSGERTQAECIRRANEQGHVELIVGVSPFWRALKETYELGMTFDQPWVPVVDADVLLDPGVIEAAVKELSGSRNVFCLDGLTHDKVLNTVRRAGIHIYNRDLLETALQYATDSIKPETRARQAMEKYHDQRTHVGRIMFGRHDHEQYYRDLYRTAYLQTVKLRTKLPKHVKQWRQLAKTDDDYRVIMAAHQAGNEARYRHTFDSTEYYGADQALVELGLIEKGPYEAA